MLSSMQLHTMYYAIVLVFLPLVVIMRCITRSISRGYHKGHKNLYLFRQGNLRLLYKCMMMLVLLVYLMLVYTGVAR